MDKNPNEDTKNTYWKDKVSGTEEEIKYAINLLKTTKNRDPRDSKELEEIIFACAKEKLNEVLKEAEEQHLCTPY